MRSPLAPSLVASDFHPRPAAAAFRLQGGMEAWLPFDARTLDLMAATSLVYAGTMPTLCAAACATPAVAALLREGGHRRIAPVIAYRDVDDMRERMNELAARGHRFLAHHIPNTAWFADACHFVPTATLIEINDKARLADFVPGEAVPWRRIFLPAELRQAPSADLSCPVVLKACTRLPTGGGYDVIVCPDAASLAAGWQALREKAGDLHAVVAERWLDCSRSWCAQVGIGRERIAYLGAAEQICSPEGRWLGNYHGRGYEAPAGVEALALAIARAGQARGFVGFAGFDIVAADGRLWVIDLNFRACGSLAQVLFQDSMCARAGGAVTRNWTAKTALPLEAARRRLGPRLADGSFAPIKAYDGAAVGEPLTVVGGFLVGDDAGHIDAIEAELNRLLEAG